MGLSRPNARHKFRVYSMDTTDNYTVVMPVVSVRISDNELYDRLRQNARRHSQGISTLVERLIDEGLRMQTHPAVMFRDGPRGRRAALAAGPEIVDVIGALIGGDVPVDQRRARAADLLNISPAAVDAALAYYAEFTGEIDAGIAERAKAAEEAEAAWVRQRALLEA